MTLQPVRVLPLILMLIPYQCSYSFPRRRLASKLQQPHGSGNRQAGYADGKLRTSSAYVVGADCILTGRGTYIYDPAAEDDTKSLQQRRVIVSRIPRTLQNMKVFGTSIVFTESA